MPSRASRRWSFQVYKGLSQALAITQDAAGNLYASGSLRGTVELTEDGKHTLTSTGLQDSFLIKLDPLGHLLWVKHISSPKAVELHDLCTGPDGSLYATGLFSAQASFDGETVTGQATDWDAFVWKLSPQ